MLPMMPPPSGERAIDTAVVDDVDRTSASPTTVEHSMDQTTIEPFHVEITDAEIADLRARLQRTRWPDQVPGTGWELGTDSTFLRQLCAHWAGGFDWGAFQERCNRYPQVRTTIDGTVVHAIVAPGASRRHPVAAAARLARFDRRVLRRHRAATARPPRRRRLPAGLRLLGTDDASGVDQLAISRTLVELMRRLGHERFVVAGGDWGATIGAWMAAYLPEAIAGLHMTMVPMRPPARDADPDSVSGVTEAEWEALDRAQRAMRTGVGYHAIQSTRPQSLAYGLTDSPAGLAGWIIEKFHGWSGGGDDITTAFSMDRLLENVSIYWFTGTINSSMRLYLEATGDGRSLFPDRAVDVPTGLAVYPADIYPIPRAWAQRQYQIVRWEHMPRGGHFAAMEVPDLYAADVAAFTAELGLSPGSRGGHGGIETCRPCWDAASQSLASLDDRVSTGTARAAARWTAS